jgi:Sigma-70 region 2
MATAQLGTVLRHLQHLAAGPGAREASDLQLLDRFAAGRDEAAFAALVCRHGPLVWQVCRRVLGHEQDAEDAFQATFLVLARGAGALARQALAGRRAPEPAAPSPAKAAERQPAKAPAGGKDVACGGRVLGPDGQPVPGARLVFVYTTARKIPENVRATSAADGRFRFTVPGGQIDRSWWEDPWQHTFVVAAADGYGFGVTRVGKPEAAGDLVVRLVKDAVPGRGRVLDLQGKPIAGVTVRVNDGLSVPAKGDLTAWLEALEAGKEGPDQADAKHLTYLYSPAFVKLFPPVKTGADGRFEIRGVGGERVAHLRIEGPTIVLARVSVMTRPGGKIRRPADKHRPDGPAVTCCGAAFDLVAAPTKPVVGVVRDKDTGRPLAGVTVQSNRVAGSAGLAMGFGRTTTDADGRYRLVGLPKGEGNEVVAMADGLPYLPAVRRVADTPGLEPVAVDIGLKRGVWVKGRVTDKATGEPLWAGVEYFAFRDNPQAAELPRQGGLTWTSTDEDGTFRGVALPGPGLIAVRAYHDRYVMGAGADRIKGPRNAVGFSTVPYLCMPVNFHALAGIAPRAGDKAITIDISLDPGRTLAGTVLGPDGRPLAGARVSGLNDMVYWESEPLAGAAFTVRSLRTDRPRLLQFVHEGKRLAGSAVVRGGDDKGPVRVTLVPWGVLTGRLRTPDGEPLTGVEVISQSAWSRT